MATRRVSDSQQGRIVMDYIIHSDFSHIRNEFKDFIQVVQKWVMADENVLLAVILGSQAHKDTHVDQWSDIDLAVVVHNQDLFDVKGDWIRKLTDYSFIYEESADIGNSMTWHVVLHNSLMIDLSVFSMPDIQEWMSASQSVKLQSQNFFKSNLLVIVDKVALLQKLMTDEEIEKMLTDDNHPPTQEEVHRSIHRFWYHVVRAVKHMCRCDTWRAYMSCNHELKTCLLEMIEWYTKAKYGWDYNTRYEGRMIAEWADADIIEQLSVVFSGYDEEDISKSLLATINLFQKLSISLLKQLDYPLYPNSVTKISHNAITQLETFIQDCQDTDES